MLTVFCASVASAAPYCKTDIFAGDSNFEGYSLFICDSDTKTETVYRYTTMKSVINSATTLDPPTTFTPSSTSHPKSQTKLSSSSARRSAFTTHSIRSDSIGTRSMSASVTAPVDKPTESTGLQNVLTKSPTAIAGMAIGSVGSYISL